MLLGPALKRSGTAFCEGGHVRLAPPRQSEELTWWRTEGGIWWRRANVIWRTWVVQIATHRSDVSRQQCAQMKVNR